jgi:hypothetical protein
VALMMAAMMLPSVAPVASMYQRSVRSWRALRLAGFTVGYLLAWAGAGIPAYLLTLLVAQLVGDHPGWATAVAVVVFAACGLYQLTPVEVPLPEALPFAVVAAAALRRLSRCAAGCSRRRPPRGVLPWLLLVADGAVRRPGRDEPGRHGGTALPPLVLPSLPSRWVSAITASPPCVCEEDAACGLQSDAGSL